MCNTSKTLHEIAFDNLDQQGAVAGSKVKVIAKAESKSGGWNTYWVEEMDEYVGKTATIRSINIYNRRITLDNGYDYPAFVLELVSVSQPTSLEVGDLVFEKNALHGVIDVVDEMDCIKACLTKEHIQQLMDLLS